MQSSEHTTGLGENFPLSSCIPVVGPISLEHSVLDLTNCPEAEIGDEVVIMGKQSNAEITFEELLQRWNKGATEFLASLTPALPRIYYSGGRPVSVTRMEHK